MQKAERELHRRRNHKTGKGVLKSTVYILKHRSLHHASYQPHISVTCKALRLDHSSNYSLYFEDSFKLTEEQRQFSHAPKQLSYVVNNSEV